MGRKFYRICLVVMVLFVLFWVGGCAKPASKEESGTTPVEAANGDIAEKPTEAPKAVDEGSSSEAVGEAEATEEKPVVVTEEGIKDVYSEIGLKAGTCLSDAMVASSRYTDIITKNFNQITLENYMKPDYILNKSKSIETGELTVEFGKNTIALLDWAKSNDMVVRGHVLVWYSQTPDWIFYQNFNQAEGLVDRDTMLARMESYIKQTFQLLQELGYLDIFYAYDIVNEAIMEDGSLRDCLWKQIIGDDYIWQAFYYADQYAPESIKLYYNDYNEQFKTKHIVALAQSLVDDTGRSLIDGIGCQGHLYTKDSIDMYLLTLKAFSKLGLDVQITELDISLGTWQNIEEPSEENLKKQGQYYYDLINRIITENTAGTTKVSGITFWGFADNLSWRGDRSPLLFDALLKPKYSYYGAMQDRDNAGF